MSLPFSLFVSLIANIQKCKPRKSRSSHLAQHRTTPCDIFGRWVDYLRKNYSPLPSETTHTLFRLLFPEEDSQRKYDIKEKRLISLLADCYSLETDFLSEWNHEANAGCLGTQLYQLLTPRYMRDDNSVHSLDIYQVDLLLDELASLSGYSHESLKTRHLRPRSRSEIIRALFRHASPFEASVIAQIILKDLRPLMSSLLTVNYTTALLEYNSTAVSYLTKEDAMRVWDPTGRMLRLSRVFASLEDVTLVYINKQCTIHPIVGKPIKIPKCIKGQGIHHALKHFKQSSRIWAETKYDGERCQIHVKILPQGQSCIKIFSKSLRESTWDRAALHDIIRRALGLHEGGSPRIQTDVVLEAEMVAHDGERIDEFWRIRALIASSAVGIRWRYLHTVDSDRSQPSMASDYGLESRHLALVFFDVLLLDSESYLFSPYHKRRQVLESLIISQPGFAMLAERIGITLDREEELKSACRALDDIFSSLTAECEEGLILKSDDGEYNQYGNPWVKLKRDYIPGLGDTVDLVAFGCSWDPERGRELGVPPSVPTTLYIGGLANVQAVKNDPQQKPHFHIYFTVSYGLTREQLEDCSFYIRHLGRVPFESVFPKSFETLDYTFDVLPTLSKPTYMFKQPILIELMGAGFSKAPQSLHYELRFPRVQKIYRRSERSWKDALSLTDLHILALSVVGRDSSAKQARDEINRIWGNPVSPGSNCPEKKKRLKREWEIRLALADGRAPKKYRSPEPSPLKSMAPWNKQERLLSLWAPQTPSQGPQHSWRGPFSSHNSTPPKEASPLSPLLPLGCLVSPDDQALPVKKGADFLSTAFVFIAKLPAQAAETTLSTAVRDFQRLHTLDALLYGCGWYTSAGFMGCEWIDKGVVFLGEDDDDWRAHTCRVLDEVSQRQNLGRKPIYVFEIGSLQGCFATNSYLPIVEPLCIYE